MTKHTSPIERRCATLAILALCTWLPGCPMTDDYFIDSSLAGAAAMMSSGGAPELNASGANSAAGADVGGSRPGGPAVHPDHMNPDPTGGGGTDSSMGMPGAGSSDAGSDAGGPGDGSGGSGGSGGLVTSGGNSNGGSSNGGGSYNLPQPACADGVSKGDPCGPSSPALCYKGCGPDNVGNKPLSCQGGAYQETQSGCTFPTPHDYSCYSVPPSLPSVCPAGVPRGGRACQIATCTVCFGGTSFSPQYQDSTGIQKEGYCVCSELGVWTCGTRPEAWPCPGAGCH
ncbi:MAG TPA: hypothetical protein VHM25_21085 [Polyangiaceae bacterium]|nr:hypothetical protein [Polyangiaceae bacterium]